MVKQLYGIEVAELILKRYCGDWVDFTGDGVFVKKELVESPDTSHVFEWTPACEMDWDDAPDPLTHPALPANFSSQELAAFLLDGVGGGMVASEYGDFSNGPDKEALDLLGIRGAKARRVLQDTYANLRAAMDIVGYPDMALLHQAEAIRRQYQDARGASLEREKVLEPNHAGLPESEYMEEYRRRLKIAVEPLDNLDREMERLSTDADISWKRWRHAMVAELLKPSTDAAEPEVPPAPQPVQPEPAPASITCSTVSKPMPVHNRRRDPLTPVIESAVRACDGRKDHAEVFNLLNEWALEEKPRQPLLGRTDKGIKWLGTNDEPKELDMKALKKRLNPRPERAARSQ